MAVSIAPVANLPAVGPKPIPASPSGANSDDGFGTLLANAIRGVEASRRDGTQAVERFLSGEGQELHTAALAVQRAELAFEMFLQVRNKVVQAYQEIMRMQI